jgi:nucleoside-diphosphate-sugar epimerase
MRALVTGATGFIGSHIADNLFQRGFDVRCTFRSSSNLRWLKDKPYELIETTLFNLESLAQDRKSVV